MICPDILTSPSIFLVCIFFRNILGILFKGHLDLVSHVVRTSDRLERFYGKFIGVFLQFGVKCLEVGRFLTLAQFAR